MHQPGSPNFEGMHAALQEAHIAMKLAAAIPGVANEYDFTLAILSAEHALGVKPELTNHMGIKPDTEQPYLGLATTRELLDELRARFEMHALGGLDYRTVDGERFAEEEAAGLALRVEEQ